MNHGRFFSSDSCRYPSLYHSIRGVHDLQENKKHRDVNDSERGAFWSWINFRFDYLHRRRQYRR